MGKTENHVSLLRPSLCIAAVTLLSRFLGLVRVRLEATLLGGGAFASAWFLAFSIPNLFRRLLGEGALGTALTPLIAGIEAEQGRENMRKELAVIFLALSAVLAGVVLVISLLCCGLRFYGRYAGISYLTNERMDLALQLVPLLMPYAFFMCLVGAATAVLNYIKVFVLPACGALLLNIFLISGLCCGICSGLSIPDIPDFLPVLSVLVLISGLIQLVLTFFLLYWYGCLPKVDFVCLKTAAVLKKLFFLALPGMIAASVLQISFIIDRMLAVKLNDQAVPALTFVDRLVDLPIGIFAVSLGAVLMSSMSRAAAANDMQQLREQLQFSLRHVYFACIPMAAGVIVFHVPLLRALCLGGNYTSEDLEATRSVAIFYSAGIPFFCSVKILLPAFYARKKMNLPLIASCCAIGTNVILNLILMGPLMQGGIALATTVSSVLNNVLLFCFLAEDDLLPDLKQLVFAALRALLLSVAVMLLLWSVYDFAAEKISVDRWVDAGATLLLFVLAGVLYIVLSFLFRVPEAREFFAVAMRKKK